jgi:hypothetical protein
MVPSSGGGPMIHVTLPGARIRTARPPAGSETAAAAVDQRRAQSKANIDRFGLKTYFLRLKLL